MGPLLAFAGRIGYPAGAILYVKIELEGLTRCFQERGAVARNISAKEFCDHLMASHGADSAATLRELGLLRSEDVGRVLFGLIEIGAAQERDCDCEEDFRGLFVLD